MIGRDVGVACMSIVMGAGFWLSESAQAEPAQPERGDVAWQYHYTSPAENGSPSTGLVLRATSRASGKQVIRAYVGQISDGTSTRFTIYLWDAAGKRIRASYAGGPRNEENLVLEIEKPDEVLSCVTYRKNRWLSCETPSGLEKMNAHARAARERRGTSEMEEFPWQELEGSIPDRSGRYATPKPLSADSTPGAIGSSPVVSQTEVPVAEPAAWDDIRLRVVIDDVGDERAYSVSKAKLDAMPSWKPGERLPMSCESAAELALGRVASMDAQPTKPPEVDSISLERVSREYGDKWYYLVSIDVFGSTGRAKYKLVCVSMDGSIIEPTLHVKPKTASDPRSNP